MAAHLVRLRLDSLIGAVRGDRRHRARTIVALVVLAVVVVAVGVAILRLRSAQGVSASVVVVLAGTALGVDPVVRTTSGTQTVGVVAAVVVTLVVGYVGWGVRALLGRLRSGGRRAWLVTCGVVLLVSLLGPLGAVTPGAVALLVVEHLTVGATLTLALRR